MNHGAMKVIQCWDDGLTSDVRLIEILRKHGATATFNLCAGLHAANRTKGWIHRGQDIIRLGWNEMREVYDGFIIANHSYTHPHLDQISVRDAQDNIIQGRDRLQQFFGQPIFGFAYPFGTYNQTVMDLVRQAGHAYARTTVSVDCPYPIHEPMEFHPSCHVLASDFWDKYERAKACGVFYFWGHSYELDDEPRWKSFETTIARIAGDPGACWGNIMDLFGGDILLRGGLSG